MSKEKITSWVLLAALSGGLGWWIGSEPKRQDDLAWKSFADCVTAHPDEPPRNEGSLFTMPDKYGALCRAASWGWSRHWWEFWKKPGGIKP